MSLFERLKNLTQPYSGDDYEDDYEDDQDLYEEPVQEPTPRARRTNPFATTAAEPQTQSAPAGATTSPAFGGQSSANMGSAGRQGIVLFHARNFDDAKRAADELRAKKAVVLNMEGEDRTLICRVVDFLSGSVYAFGGGCPRKIAPDTYLFCPSNMVISDLDVRSQTGIDVSI